MYLTFMEGVSSGSTVSKRTQCLMVSLFICEGIRDWRVSDCLLTCLKGVPRDYTMLLWYITLEYKHLVDLFSIAPKHANAAWFSEAMVWLWLF